MDSQLVYGLSSGDAIRIRSSGVPVLWFPIACMRFASPRPRIGSTTSSRFPWPCLSSSFTSPFRCWSDDDGMKGTTQLIATARHNSLQSSEDSFCSSCQFPQSSVRSLCVFWSLASLLKDNTRSSRATFEIVTSSTYIPGAAWPSQGLAGDSWRPLHSRVLFTVSWRS